MRGTGGPEQGRSGYDQLPYHTSVPWADRAEAYGWGADRNTKTSTFWEPLM